MQAKKNKEIGSLREFNANDDSVKSFVGWVVVPKKTLVSELIRENKKHCGLSMAESDKRMLTV